MKIKREEYEIMLEQRRRQDAKIRELSDLVSEKTRSTNLLLRTLKEMKEAFDRNTFFVGGR